jgi:hypothetical protein
VIDTRKRQQIAAVMGALGGGLAALAGIAQIVVGARIPEWSGAKDAPLVLGALTVVLGVVASGGARSLSGDGLAGPGRRAVAAGAMLVPAGLVLGTVGRLGYVPCALLVIGAAYAVAAGRAGDVGEVVVTHWRAVLLSVLGGVEVLMAATAVPTVTLVAGAVGGLVVGVAAWVPGRLRVRVGLVLAGTVPFAALTWWSAVTPLLAVVAVGIVMTRLSVDATR